MSDMIKLDARTPLIGRDRPNRRAALQLIGGTTAALATLPSRRPAWGRELVPIRILGQASGWGSSESVIVADVKGFFRKEGLQLELVYLPIEKYTMALESGVTDFSPNADYIYFVNVRDKELNARQVVSSSPYIDPRRPNDGLFVLEDSPIHGPADLRGKTIAVASVQFSSSWYTLEYISRAGLRRQDINLIAIPPFQHEQALLGRHVDAIYAYQPIDAMLRRKGGYRQLFSTADISGRRIQRAATMVKNELIERNPDIVRRYVAAIANAIEWANKNQDEVVRIGIDRGALDPKLAPYIYTLDGKGDYSVLKWPEHGVQNADDIEFWLQIAERREVVPKGRFKASDLFTDEFNPYA
jgi:ABC-type nitrate/sulfonate/bicarbonate transport system substrate-binding protein